MRATIGLVCALLCAAGRAVPADKPDAEFQKLIETYWQAWSSLKPDKATPFYSPDPEAVYFDIAPLKYTGWNEYKQGVLKVMATWASASITPNSDLKVTRRGDLAWTINTFAATINQKDGKSQKMTGRHTAIWEKRGGRWIIVHEHVSAPMPE